MLVCVPVLDADAQGGAERRRRRADLAPDDTREMRLIGETELACETRQAPFAIREALERKAHTRSVAIARDRLAGLHSEDPAQVVRRDRDDARQLEKPDRRLDRDRFPCIVDDTVPCRGRRGPSAVTDARSAFAYGREELTDSLGQVERVATPERADEPAVDEIRSRAGENRPSGGTEVAPERADGHAAEDDLGALVAAVARMRHLLLVAGLVDVERDRIEERLETVDAAPEAPAAHKDDAIALRRLGRRPRRAPARAEHVFDRDPFRDGEDALREHGYPLMRLGLVTPRSTRGTSPRRVRHLERRHERRDDVVGTHLVADELPRIRVGVLRHGDPQLAVCLEELRQPCVLEPLQLVETQRHRTRRATPIAVTATVASWAKKRTTAALNSAPPGDSSHTSERAAAARPSRNARRIARP